MKQGVIVVNKNEEYRYRIVGEFISGKLKRKEAALMLGVSERSIARVAKRIRLEGLKGIKHGNTGRSPANKLSFELRDQVVALVRRNYFDFNLTHALEKLSSVHRIEIRPETFRKWMHAEGLVKQRHKRRAAPRVYRDRMPSEGMLLQMDGSPHRWCSDEQVWTMISAIDDATGDIPYAGFFHSEDTINCMQVLQKIIELKGLPECLYVDRAGIFTSAKRQNFTQFARACDELGIRILFAGSPQAKGRIERSFKTLQDRLIPELRIRNIHRMPRANDFLQNEFLPNYWRPNLRVCARESQIRYRALSDSLNLKEILCLKDWRAIAADQTISWDGTRQAVLFDAKYSIRGQRVEIRTYQDLTNQAFFAGTPVGLSPIEKPLRLFA